MKLYSYSDLSAARFTSTRREAELRAAPFVAKPQKDKQGKPIFHALNKDWDLP